MKENNPAVDAVGIYYGERDKKRSPKGISSSQGAFFISNGFDSSQPPHSVTERSRSDNYLYNSTNFCKCTHFRFRESGRVFWKQASQKLADLFVQLNKLLQVYEPVFSSLLVLVEEDFRPLWELAGERGVACLVVEERLVASVALF